MSRHPQPQFFKTFAVKHFNIELAGFSLYMASLQNAMCLQAIVDGLWLVLILQTPGMVNLPVFFASFPLGLYHVIWHVKASSNAVLQNFHCTALRYNACWLRLVLDFFAKRHVFASFCLWLVVSLDLTDAWDGELSMLPCRSFRVQQCAGSSCSAFHIASSKQGARTCLTQKGYGHAAARPAQQPHRPGGTGGGVKGQP